MQTTTTTPAHVSTHAGDAVDNVIDACGKIIRTRRYSLHPFVTRLAQLRPSKAALGNWATQKYHQVRLQNAIFSIIYSKSELRDVRHFMIEQLIAEETRFACGSDSHYNLMARFATACGVTAEELLRSTPAAPVREYVETLLSIMSEEHFTVGLLSIYAIECQSSESVGKLLAMLRRLYDFTDEDLEWFVVHAGEDDQHADAGLELVTRYAHLNLEFESDALASVSRICNAWLKLHDFYLGTLQQAAS
jgi:pyrroloquinoline-quinone synthase